MSYHSENKRKASECPKVGEDGNNMTLTLSSLPSLDCRVIDTCYGPVRVREVAEDTFCVDLDLFRVGGYLLSGYLKIRPIENGGPWDICEHAVCAIDNLSLFCGGVDQQTLNSLDEAVMTAFLGSVTASPRFPLPHNQGAVAEPPSPYLAVSLSLTAAV